jgi:hypothetical protein
MTAKFYPWLPFAKPAAVLVRAGRVLGVRRVLRREQA